MRNRFLLCVLLFACLSFNGAAQNSPAVRVTWIGQSGFHLQTEGGPAVVSDPPPANFGFIYPTTPADAVTISHTHGDHTGNTAVAGTPTLVDGRNVTERREVTAAGTTFTIIPGFHDTTGATRNALITWTQGGLRFMQGGDYGQATLTPEPIDRPVPCHGCEPWCERTIVPQGVEPAHGVEEHVVHQIGRGISWNADEDHGLDHRGVTLVQLGRY